MRNFSTSPQYAFKSIISNKNLIMSLTKREILGRYKGSMGGILWSLINPILMLGVYTFVFGFIFKARFASLNQPDVNFPIALFIGLIIFGVFSDCLSRAPTLITAHANYVKKVVFPLELLPIITLCSSLFHAMISFFVWLVFYFIVIGVPNYTVFIFPFMLLPIIAFSLGSMWLFSALGVYLRDISQIIGFAVTALMFLSAIFYPISSLPDEYQIFMLFNPFAVIIDQSRSLLMFEQMPDPQMFSIISGVSFLYMCFGFFFFQKCRKGFADVI